MQVRLNGRSRFAVCPKQSRHRSHLVLCSELIGERGQYLETLMAAEQEIQTQRSAATQEFANS